MKNVRSLVIGIAIATAVQGAAAATTLTPMHAGASLARCGEGTCLLVTGRRADANAPVMLAGRPVTVRGAHRWRVALPMATVRAWSEPFARTISVAVGGFGGGDGEARLPIGLLGHVPDLDFLDVRASR